MTMPETRTAPSRDTVRRQNEVFDLYWQFRDRHESDRDYDPDDDPEFVRRSREIMGEPPLPEHLP